MIDSQEQAEDPALIYMFKCSKCGKSFEVEESLAQHERHQEKCPDCGSKQVQQRFGSVQVKTSKKS